MLWVNQARSLCRGSHSRNLGKLAHHFEGANPAAKPQAWQQEAENMLAALDSISDWLGYHHPLAVNLLFLAHPD
jgi:hypothetical protein